MLSKVRNGDVVIENRYDYMGRRVEKRENWAAVRYVYGGPAAGGTGWLVLEVRDGTGGVMEAYTHGLDLSGTLEGAGGIGGILSVTHPSATNATYFYHYDGNGNVVRLTDTNGAVVGHYEYNPYGNAIPAGGTEAQSNAFRFSTKYLDNETGLYYYGYRYYSAGMGRWVNRISGSINGYSLLSRSYAIQYQLQPLNSSLGTAHCNPDTGEIDITNNDEECTRPCTQDHEEVHEQQMVSACRKVKVCLDSSNAPAFCAGKWHDFINANQALFECEAYISQALCLAALAPEGGCECPQNQESEKCCAVIEGTLDDAIHDRDHYCGQVSPGQQPIPIDL